MTSILPISVAHAARAATCLAVAVVSLPFQHAASACETPADLNIEVTTKFETTPIRNDYTLGDIATLARQLHRATGRPLLGFYASEFGYTINLVPEGDQACPAHIETIVTLRLQHRLIEIGQEAATNSCVYPVALRHYRRLAKVDEQTVERFGARAAVMLGQASPALKQIHPAHAEDLDVALREQIRAVVDAAIARLDAARQDAKQSVNSSGEVKELTSSCAI